MRVVRNTFRLQYTNFILKNSSGLGTKEKNNKILLLTFIVI